MLAWSIWVLTDKWSKNCKYYFLLLLKIGGVGWFVLSLYFFWHPVYFYNFNFFEHILFQIRTGRNSVFFTWGISMTKFVKYLRFFCSFRWFVPKHWRGRESVKTILFQTIWAVFWIVNWRLWKMVYIFAEKIGVQREKNWLATIFIINLGNDIRIYP